MVVVPMEEFSGRKCLFECVVDKEPASKANARRIVKFGKRYASIKSKKALDFIKAFKADAPPLHRLLTRDVVVDITIFYASRRPDLDESIVLDALQGIAYKNDRQVKKKIVSWGLDPDRPRVAVRVYALQAGDVPGDQGRGERLRAAKKRRVKVVDIPGFQIDMPGGEPESGELEAEVGGPVPPTSRP